jgi:hypothetical protein
MIGHRLPGAKKKRKIPLFRIPVVPDIRVVQEQKGRPRMASVLEGLPVTYTFFGKAIELIFMQKGKLDVGGVYFNYGYSNISAIESDPGNH